MFKICESAEFTAPAFVGRVVLRHRLSDNCFVCHFSQVINGETVYHFGQYFYDIEPALECFRQRVETQVTSTLISWTECNQ